MHRITRPTPLLLIALLLLALTAVACSPNKAGQLNQEGNDAFAQQAFQDALAAYQTAQIEEPELAEPYYNAANALYRQGAYEAALEQLQIALSFADQQALAQAGYYNLGNTAYNAQDLQSAIESYKQALLLNPDDQDAKYNLELALQQQQQQQNEEQQQEQQDQEQSEQDQQDQQQSEQGEQQEQQQNQDGEGEQEQEQQQGDQPSEEQQSEQGEPQDEEQNQDGEGQQDQQEGQPGEGDPQEAQPDPQQDGQLNELPQPGQRMTEEQARQLLAAIARDGETLQERLGQIFRGVPRPPVQDW